MKARGFSLCRGRGRFERGLVSLRLLYAIHAGQELSYDNECDAGAPERGRPPGGERRLHYDWLRTRAALFEEPRGLVRRRCLAVCNS